MAGQKYGKDTCIALLRDKQQSLSAQGLERYPQRDDFDLEQVVAIKAHFGPWPRALEAAGLKQLRPDNQKQSAREKHIRRKKIRTEIIKAKSQNKSEYANFAIDEKQKDNSENNRK